MSDQPESKKPRISFPDRFTVQPENLDKIGRLIDQVTASCRGIELKRKDLLNWIVERAPAELSAADMKDLSSRYYNEERFLKSVLEEIRAAKARGERRTLDEILQAQAQAGLPVKRRPRERKSDASAEGLEDSPSITPVPTD